ADDAVDRHRRNVRVQGLLEAPYSRLRLGSEDPVHRQALARVAREVAELELLRPPADGVALTPLRRADDERGPRVRAHDAVHRQVLLLLERADGGLGRRT